MLKNLKKIGTEPAKDNAADFGGNMAGNVA